MPKMRRPAVGSPTTHTVVIGDPATMWAKLAWDIDNFSKIQRANPDLPEPLGFAAVNVCIAAWSLRNWTWAAYAKRERSGPGDAPDENAFNARLQAAVPQQRMCEAIANTAKHAHLNEGDWRGGAVQIDWHEATESGPATLILRQVHPDSSADPLALNTFGDLERDWLDFIKELGFPAPRHVYDLEFRQRWLEEIFGPRSERIDVSKPPQS